MPFNIKASKINRVTPMKKLVCASLLFAGASWLSSGPASAQESDATLNPECMSLVEVVGQTQSGLAGVFQNGRNVEDLFGQIAQVTSNAVVGFEALELTDEQLQDYRDRFVTIYTDISSASQNLSEAERSGDEAAFQEAYVAFPTLAGREERSLIRELRTYCDA